LKVALVGQARTQGGFSQWLQSTRKGRCSTASAMNRLETVPEKACS
jgi:hypothetical protein